MADDTIADRARKPKRVKTPTAEFESHSIPDQIAAEKHEASKQAASNRGGWFGMRVSRVQLVRRHSSEGC